MEKQKEKLIFILSLLIFYIFIVVFACFGFYNLIDSKIEVIKYSFYYSLTLFPIFLSVILYELLKKDKEKFEKDKKNNDLRKEEKDTDYSISDKELFLID